MEKYCCFNCPMKDFSEKELFDKCSECGMHYGFPLDYMPTNINGYNIEESIDRGFYGAVYIATSNDRIPKKRVLKIIPKKIYEFFNKDFEDECKRHSKLNNEHIVEIYDYFDADVNFNEIIIPCHICVLDFVNGSPLKKEIESEEISIERLTQIVIDLLEILEVFKNNGKSHNDLHPGNILISNLSLGTKRIDQIDNTIKLIVIDLNSTSDETQSTETRLGDINWIGKIILDLSKKFIERKEKNNEELTDKENRILVHFENYGKLLSQKVTNTRIPNYEDLIYDIKNTYRHVVDPWNETFNLQSFDYAYNAQTLKPNYVPALFVDPDNKFFNETKISGPLIIHGMRGCGKTLLLLGLSFYSRISSLNDDQYTDKGIEGIIDRIKNDGFIGLYINSNRLLDPTGKKSDLIFKPLERIYLRYCLEALRTIRTLKKIDDTIVDDYFYEKLTNEIILKVSNINIREVKSDRELDDILSKKINLLEKNEGDEICISIAAPALFEDLSTTISSCCPELLNPKIFYLLDDVSTRYLNHENIIQIISTFIFQSSKCAFKITTEEQTLNAILYSPGIQEKTRIGRDLQTFNLGNLVNQQIRHDKNFVINILEKRNQLITKDSNSYPHPVQLLGDISLNEIALNITKTGNNKKNKKRFYHGITMLAKVCVGDIGDIIHIYNLMLEEYKAQPHTPLKIELQNKVYQNVSTNKLFDIDRNKNNLKDFVLTFAEASYKLLMESRDSERLRQYNTIYVKITSGDQKFQINKLRELVDAGIFIYDGSPEAPRTTGNDTNPLLQFKLAFRKLLGLTNFIGISHSDRFELSGSELEAWLKDPQKGKSILLKTLVVENSESNEDMYDFDEIIENKASQTTIDFVNSEEENKEIFNFFVSENKILMNKHQFKTDLINDCKQYVLGIGFEDRTYESLRRIIDSPNISKIYGIKHELKEGRFNDIMQLLNQSDKEIVILNLDDINVIDYSLKTLIDVSGLSKSMIFNLIISARRNLNKIVILETEAESLSPSDVDLKEIINSQEQATEILKTVTENIESGELKPYSIKNVYSTDTDESNSRVILCFSSPKFERMLTFLDQKQYDKILIIDPNKDNYRSKLARLSSKVIQDKYSSIETEVVEIDTDNQNEILKAMTILYQKYYLQEGCNFDIALTGSKIQTFCASVFAGVNKINNCWYISPKEWKSKSFSKGVSNTFIYFVS